MQKLQFEATWDRALSVRDRLEIESIFQETKLLYNTEVVFIPIREAINHREALLVSVLVHNFSDYSMAFHNKRLQYRIKDEIIGDHLFTLPTLSVPSNVSMPWTFIFPKGSFIRNVPFENGELNII